MLHATNTAQHGPDVHALVGRDRELRAIRAFFEGYDRRTLAVTGLSGSGKTALVVRAVAQLGRDVATLRISGVRSGQPHAELVHDGVTEDVRLQPRVPRPEPGQPAGPYVDKVLRLLERVPADGASTRVLFVDDVCQVHPAEREEIVELAEAVRTRGWRLAITLVTADGLYEDEAFDVLELAPLDRLDVREVLARSSAPMVATDVADRVARLGGGVPGIALDIAKSLDDAEIRGAEAWPARWAVPPAVRRAYRPLVARLSPEQLTTLAAVAGDVSRGDGRAWIEVGAPGAEGLASLGIVVPDRGRWRLRHPLVALLAQDLLPGGPAVLDMLDAAPERWSLEAAIAGLHLRAVARGLARGPAGDPRLTALRFQVALLSGQVEQPGAAAPVTPDDAHGGSWTDLVWWHDPAAVPVPARQAGRRLAERFRALEQTGALDDAAAFRLDIGAVATTGDLDGVGVHLLVRGLLALGRPTEASALLARCAAPGASTVVERVALSLASAMVATVEGRCSDAGDHLDTVTRLRPDTADWLTVRGLRVLQRAIYGGEVPTETVPSRSGSWSPRALAEYAVDLGASHLALARLEDAAGFLTLALEHCSWPYQGRVHVRADLVEAVTATRGDPGGEGRGATGDLRRRSGMRHLLPLLADEISRDELTTPGAVASHARTLAVLADGADAERWFDKALDASHPPAPTRVRIQTLVSAARSRAAHDAGAAEVMLDEARMLTRLSGKVGWLPWIEASRELVGTTEPARGWDALSRDERELVALVLAGTTNAQMAARLFLSERTVVNRLRHVYAALRVRDRRDLVRIAEEDPPAWLG
ncbi:LuxR C-terminal-related transcriptional regulator [Xylanimonas oleitrophica]|uniref:LuxR C-terminal-related transcriptional regulator n=1 Tax=Xylanimonas oleitrophica TaxID=2607479 RepID=UPI001C54C856|nr:LuxR C-terminal-related transcriptional regulator [Xylanimonas oleitrophica]